MFRRVAIALSTITLIPMSTAYSQGKTQTHHDGGKFKNPWPSFISYGWTDAIKMGFSLESNRPQADIKEKKIPVPVKMNWELIHKSEKESIRATWLGHACVLVQINGFNILLDPIFSESYDHLDVDTVQKLSELHPNCKFYVPLGNKPWFTIKDKENKVIELDWWEESMLENQVRLTCTPCQHFTGRGLFDRNKTLWASWCIEGVTDNVTRGKVFFGGDTGYRSIPQDTPPEQQYDLTFLDKLPFCPAFKEIGEKFGGFDLALIPIGAYSPRWFMSPIHCCPEDAIRVHQDVKSKKSVSKITNILLA
ncbi:beta-lactamase superfamily domain-containing protein [Sporodiniella umbellata]|nr:beta-lactamase superfamily domain-containing protein [Sporodiniella umbellata]